MILSRVYDDNIKGLLISVYTPITILSSIEIIISDAKFRRSGGFAALPSPEHLCEKEEKTSEYKSDTWNSPTTIAKMLNEVFALNNQAEEYLYMIASDVKCKPIGVFEVSHGTVNSCLVTPREIFIRALLAGAACIFIAHNHPSGDCEPSDKDIQITKDIKAVADLINIHLLDHIIVGNSEYYSFKENHLLD